MRERLIRYFWIGLTLTIAIVTIIVSTNSVRDMRRANADSQRHRRHIAEYSKAIADDSLIIYQLTHSPEHAERYARENFNMQRPGETVYILIDQE